MGFNLCRILDTRLQCHADYVFPWKCTNKHSTKGVNLAVSSSSVLIPEGDSGLTDVNIDLTVDLNGLTLDRAITVLANTIDGTASEFIILASVLYLDIIMCLLKMWFH